ncbi:hypothetical protein QQF64_008756 [Cirrhinus molitorella]|uniref:Uncharacterized protein n=1 Tax=Cirrhinus molitorella TaxID=172907 RepID=A0ABR3M736_9TELE
MKREREDRGFDIQPIDEGKGTKAKSDGAPFQIHISDVPPAVCAGATHGEQGLPQGCSVDHANKSRPVTCSIAPFEGQASSVRKKKARRALFSMREQGGKEGKESRHLLPWLLAKYEDPAIQKAPFSCSQPANVTRLEGKAAQEETRRTRRTLLLMIRARAAHHRKEK